jgi:hypothetical protein
MNLTTLATLFSLAIISSCEELAIESSHAFASVVKNVCKGPCRCDNPSDTLIVDSKDQYPATCQDIRWNKKVKCSTTYSAIATHGGKGGKKDREEKRCVKAIGACVSEKAQFKPYCKLPEYLLQGCSLAKEGKKDKCESGCGSIAIKNDTFACLKHVETGKQCEGVCPPGFYPQCFEVRGLGCKIPEPAEEERQPCCDKESSSSSSSVSCPKPCHETETEEEDNCNRCWKDDLSSSEDCKPCRKPNKPHKPSRRHSKAAGKGLKISKRIMAVVAEPPVVSGESNESA